MAAYIYPVVLLCIVAVLLNYCAADEKAEFTARITSTMKECAAQHNTNQKELMDAVMHPDNFPKDAHKCAWACIFKKMELMDSNGIYMPEAAIEIVQKYSKGQKLDEGIAAAKRCVSVNDQSEGDGAAGCDRAKLLVDCLLKDLLNASEERILTLVFNNSNFEDDFE